MSEVDLFGTTLRRGTLEYCVLALIEEGERYGLEIVREMSTQFGLTTSEGTLYPLLSRLRRTAKIATTWRESPQGPPRSYYTLTLKGEVTLRQFRTEWVTFRKAVDKILGTERS